MVTKDFQCSAGHVTEHVVTLNTVEMTCGEPQLPHGKACRRLAHVVILSAPSVKYMGDGFTGAAKDARYR